MDLPRYSYVCIHLRRGTHMYVYISGDTQVGHSVAMHRMFQHCDIILICGHENRHPSPYLLQTHILLLKLDAQSLLQPGPSVLYSTAVAEMRQESQFSQFTKQSI